jgi:hypothetical protein
MNLIAYSDSEESDNDAPQAPKPAAKPAPKPSFQKVVDRSNPGKIKLNLPTPRAQAEKDDIEAEAPPAKKARTGGGAFSGFNSMLPAPKKPKVDATTAAPISGKRGLGKSLGSGVNLRTGAEPAFQRAPKEEDYDENGDPIKKEESGPMKKEDFRKLFNLPPPKTETKVESTPEVPALESPKPEPSVAKPASKSRFMPLSVARGKKKKPINRPAGAVPDDVKLALESTRAAPVTAPKAPVKPKVSLFGAPQEDDGPATTVSHGEYKPLLYGADEDEDAPVPDDAFNNTDTYQAAPSSHHPATSEPQGLNDLASELNLSEAERRRLFGRRGQGPDLSAANIIEFNTDTEYAHNERLRQQGETVQHNALKSISGTGRNSLRSLINVASTQKEALEEHFASGRRNKKEAGNKYGW